MIVSDRIRALREEKGLSQGDIEKRSGLLRCYISRVENGHTVPALETMEKMAQALGVPLYQLFYEGEGAPEPPKKIRMQVAADDPKELPKFYAFLSRITEDDRQLLLSVARRMALKAKQKKS